MELFDRGGQSGGYYKQHNGRDMVVLKEKPAFRTGDPAYFDFLDRTYGNEDVKIPIKGTGYFSVGKPARLTLEAKLAEGRREGGAFGETLREAAGKGVRILAYDCLVKPDEMTIDQRIEVHL